MKTKLLRIVRENFDVRHSGELSFAWKKNNEELPLCSFNSFNLIAKMLECIYPQGRHYSIMRHSRRFKQARRAKTMRILEIASVSLITLVIIVILVLNTCCGSGIQY